MMIRAAATLLLASLAMAAGNENLRGNNNNKPQEEARALQRMNSPGLGEMDCVEQEDLSVVCTFRINPPSDFTTAKLLRDCPRGANGSFCLTTEVYRTSFVDSIPGSVQRPQFPVQPEPQQPVQQQPPPVQQQRPSVELPFVGRCPDSPQATGMACGRYVPNGQREISCYFGRTQCNCALNDNPSVTEGWACRFIPDDIPAQPVQQSPVQQQPVQQQPSNVVTTPARPVTVIDANINNVAVSPVAAPAGGTPPPFSSSTGQILPIFANNPSCPKTKAETGDPCSWGQACSYYTSATTAEDCRCDGSYEFFCSASRHPGLQSPP